MIPWGSRVPSFCLFVFLDPGPFWLQRDALLRSLRFQPRLWYVAPWWADGVLYFTWSTWGELKAWDPLGYLGWVRVGAWLGKVLSGCLLSLVRHVYCVTKGTLHWDTESLRSSGHMKTFKALGGEDDDE